MKKISERIFQLESDISRFPYEAYERKPETDLWKDLDTDPRPYDEEYEKNYGESLHGITKYIDEIKNLPKHIVMFGWFDLLKLTEMPNNNFAWTIISKHFLDVVKRLGFNDYCLINIRVLERSQFDNVGGENPRKYEDDNFVKNLIYDDEMFYGFQILPRVSLLTDDSDVHQKKITWREDVSEIPFFFREPRHGSGILVNQEARDALEKAGIQGIEFKPPFSL
jgi:hypothetical protein